MNSQFPPLPCSCRWKAIVRTAGAVEPNKVGGLVFGNWKLDVFKRVCPRAAFAAVDKMVDVYTIPIIRKRGGHLSHTIIVSSGRAIPERSLLTHEPQPAINCMNAVGGQTVHAAASCSKVMDTLRLSASIKRLSRLHRGIEPDVFQLETVLGVRSKAAATAEVPPSVSIMSVAVCMATPYGIRKLAARANYE
jgi:hypothetical protein